MPPDAMRRAQELLDDPDTPEDAKAKLRAKMASYSEKAPRKPMLGDPRALSGGEALEQTFSELPAGRTQQEELAKWETVREGAPKPKADTPGEQLVEQTFDTQAAAAADVPYPEMQRRRAEQLRVQSEGLEESLKIRNLSKDPALYAPPEYRSQRSQMPGQTPFHNPALHEAIPHIGHTVWEEPSLEQFRADMDGDLRALGLNPERVTEEDPIYKRYADAMWAQAYKQAAAQDRSIVRRSQLQGDDSYAMSVINNGLAAIMGAQETAGFNVPAELGAGVMVPFMTPDNDPIEGERLAQEMVVNARGLQEQHPVANFLGSLGGALLPGGGFQAGLGKLMGGAPRAMGAAGQLATGMGAGAVMGAGSQLISDTVRNLGDMSRGADPTLSGGEMVDRAGLSGVLGGAFGLGGEALGMGARGLKKKILESPSVGKDVATMEAAGIEPGIWRTEPQAVKDARARTAAAGLGGDVKSQAANELRQPMARAWRDIDELGSEGELPALQDRVDGYLRSEQGKARVPVTNTANAVIDLLESRASASGEDLPFMLNQEKFRRVRNDLFETKTVAPDAVGSLKNAGWRALPEETESGLIVMARPKQLDARELSTVIDKLDDLAGFSGKELTGPKEKAYRLFSAAVRKDRDQFVGNKWTGNLRMTTPDGETVEGFSALMGRLSEAKRGKTRLLDAAGLSGPAPGISSSIEQVQKYASRAPGEWKEELADVPQKMHELTELTNQKLASMTEQERSALRSYTREHLVKGYAQSSGGIDTVIEKLAISHPTDYGTLYRGFRMSPEEIAAADRDGFITNSTGHVPATYNQQLSLAVAGKEKDGVPVLFRIKNADKGYSFSGDNLRKLQNTVLIPRGSRMQIVGRERVPVEMGDGRTIEVEMFDLKTRAPKVLPRSAVREGLGVDMTEEQAKKVDRLAQSYRQQEGTSRGDDAALAVARAAGVESELKMWAGIMAANRLKAGREGIAGGPGGIRGWLSGSGPQLVTRGVSMLNKLGAKPLGQAPQPSQELRTLLRRLVPFMKHDSPMPGAPRLLGMAGGGGSAWAQGMPSEQRKQQLLEPGYRSAVVGDLPLDELVYGGMGLSPEEEGIFTGLVNSISRAGTGLAESVGRGIGQSMPKPELQKQPEQELE